MTLLGKKPCYWDSCQYFAQVKLLLWTIQWVPTLVSNFSTVLTAKGIILVFSSCLALQRKPVISPEFVTDERQNKKRTSHK